MYGFMEKISGENSKLFQPFGMLYVYSHFFCFEIKALHAPSNVACCRQAQVI